MAVAILHGTFAFACCDEPATIPLGRNLLRLIHSMYEHRQALRDGFAAS